ncbi:16S rRNA (cytosine(1402)-N(4))-methyltransferase [Helicobacter sp. CLO-3]|nr:16S rRNA (cytosine(1402)-N(4))-methyltransferase [Helicobacter sp. CLO-3]OHU82845.1 16S rRNA (cytosine(1402)-N(4))-methyltransferase [Helicobacter sp. CLO-3]
MQSELIAQDKPATQGEPPAQNELFAQNKPLAQKPQKLFIDCTLGLGGHSGALLKAHSDIALIGIDQDEFALNIARENLALYASRARFIHANFAQGLVQALEIAQNERLKIAGVLADIGVSSLQLDDASRGFGFSSERLDMRMDTRASRTASDILRDYSEFELAGIFRDYGEIKEHKKMARLTKEYMQTHKGGFSSAREFSDFLAKHFKSSRIHPATLAFQALRIEVNDELGVLKSLLDTLESTYKSHPNLLSGAIVAIISFHSLEDRIIKERFKEWSRACICPASAYRCECGGDNAKGAMLTKKPIIASEAEIRKNPRARSAKLRAFRLK